eukprot:2432941-Pleurochrysis_carterae.AAC.1
MEGGHGEGYTFSEPPYSSADEASLYLQRSLICVHVYLYACNKSTELKPCLLCRSWAISQLLSNISDTAYSSSPQHAVLKWAVAHIGSTYKTTFCRRNQAARYHTRHEGSATKVCSSLNLWENKR